MSPRELIGVATICAELVECNRSTWLRWDDEQRTPESVTIGGGAKPRRYWRRSEILLWSARGCPDRRRFAEILKVTKLRRCAG